MGNKYGLLSLMESLFLKKTGTPKHPEGYLPRCLGHTAYMKALRELLWTVREKTKGQQNTWKVVTDMMEPNSSQQMFQQVAIG